MRLRTKYTQRLPTAPGLRLDIPFFEGSGTKALDISGKSNHGTITDAVWTRDENGVAMSFNGTSAYIGCGNDSSLNITDAITVEAWVKRNADGAYHTIYNRAAPATDYIWVEIHNNNKPLFRIATGGVPYNITTTSKTVTVADGWTHLVYTWDGSTMRIAINGEFDTNTKSFTGSITYADSNTYIGVRRDALYFNGTIKGLRIYAVALTAEQIKRRYEQTKRDYVRAS